jgi:aspartate aminotransferase-like enzyme
MTNWNPLGSVPPYPADHYASLADRIGGILGTSADVLLVQGEAIVALEAVAASVAAPGRTALVLVTSPYGETVAAWLEAHGARVRTLRSDGIRPIPAEALDAELHREPAEVVYVTHGEAATGIVNPLKELSAIARAHGAQVIVDAVASVGGHPLAVDDWGIDIAVVGAQKSLAGPSSLSAVSVSPRGWDALESASASRASAPASVLSLLDLKHDWLDAGRGALPGMPDPLSFWALDAAVDAVLAEGVDAVIQRHVRASSLARSAVRALVSVIDGAVPAPATDAAASTLVTLAPVPEGVDESRLLDAAARLDGTLSSAHGAAAGRFVRINHTGARANTAAVATSVLAYGIALRSLGVPADLNAAGEALAC